MSHQNRSITSYIYPSKRRYYTINNVSKAYSPLPHRALRLRPHSQEQVQVRTGCREGQRPQGPDLGEIVRKELGAG